MRIRKQIAAVLAAVLMFAMLVPVKAAESTDLIFLNYTNFTEMNGWSKDSAGLFGSYAAPMKSSLNGKSAVGLDACAYFSSAASGTYSVWIRCLYQGSEDRRFRIGFNTGVLPGFVSNLEADSSGSYAWKWQKAGEVYLKKRGCEQNQADGLQLALQPMRCHFACRRQRICTARYSFRN